MTENRSIKRFDLRLPMLIKGKTHKGDPIRETSKSINISSQGAYFLMKNPVEEEADLHVTLTLPFNVRKFSLTCLRNNKKFAKNKVSLKGKVIRIAESLQDSDEKMGIALSFYSKTLLRL